MSRKTCLLRIYSQSGVVEVEVVQTTEDFAEKLASAFEVGPVVLDTSDETKLVINPFNVVMLEIVPADEPDPMQ